MGRYRSGQTGLTVNNGSFPPQGGLKNKVNSGKPGMVIPSQSFTKVSDCKQAYVSKGLSAGALVEAGVETIPTGSTLPQLCGMGSALVASGDMI